MQEVMSSIDSGRSFVHSASRLFRSRNGECNQKAVYQYVQDVPDQRHY